MIKTNCLGCRDMVFSFRWDCDHGSKFRDHVYAPGRQDILFQKSIYPVIRSADMCMAQSHHSLTLKMKKIAWTKLWVLGLFIEKSFFQHLIGRNPLKIDLILRFAIWLQLAISHFGFFCLEEDFTDHISIDIQNFESRKFQRRGGKMNTKQYLMVIYLPLLEE